MEQTQRHNASQPRLGQEERPATFAEGGVKQKVPTPPTSAPEPGSPGISASRPGLALPLRTLRALATTCSPSETSPPISPSERWMGKGPVPRA